MDTVVFDVDGTLVDTNYHHAVAWFRAFAGLGLTVPVWKIHRAIGMGGDRLVAAVAGQRVEDEHGDAARGAWKREFAPMLAEVPAFPGAQEALRECCERGYRVVLASSGEPAHVDHYVVELLRADKLAARWTTAKDADRTKPDPDLLQAALNGFDDGAAVVVGDSTWDCLAAGRLGLPSIGVLTGGTGAAELRDAGASEVFESVGELRPALADLVARLSGTTQPE